ANPAADVIVNPPQIDREHAASSVSTRGPAMHRGGRSSSEGLLAMPSAPSSATSALARWSQAVTDESQAFDDGGVRRAACLAHHRLKTVATISTFQMIHECGEKPCSCRPEGNTRNRCRSVGPLRQTVATST